MRAVLALLIAPLLVLMPAAAAAQVRAQGTVELMRALARGGYVIYFRHGHTHWQEKILEQAMGAEGRFDVANCATQRMLDAIGRDDARAIAAAFAAGPIPVGAIYASRFCRPSEYVQIITGKPPERVDWLTGLSTPPTLQRLREVIAGVPPAGTNVVLGGHGERPFDLTGLVISEGDALVFDPRTLDARAPGHFKIAAWIKPREWLELASALHAASARTIRDVLIEGDDTLSAAVAREAVTEFVGRPASTEVLYDAALKVERLLRERGRGSFRADAIEDGSGRVRIAIQPRPLGRLTLRGNRRFDEANVRASLPELAPGRVPDSNALVRGLQLARDNPAKSTTVLFSGDAKAVDAEVSIADVKPWSVYTGANNAGVSRPDRARVFAGGTHANLWNRDHVAAASVALSPEHASEAHQWGASYRVPVYSLGGSLGAHYARSNVAGGLVAETIRITEPGHAAGLTWKQHLANREEYQHHLLARIESKSYTGPGVPVAVDARPITLGYGGHWEEQWIGWQFNLAYTQNFNAGRRSDEATYAAARPGAESRWNLLRLDGDWMRILTYDWRLLVRVRAQIATNPLIAGEQFALGSPQIPWGSAHGVWTRMPWIEAGGVRGFDERALLGDSGGQTSIELWSWRLAGQDLRASTFYDFGQVRRQDPSLGQRGVDTVASLGIGAHYQLRGNIAASAHFAHVARGAGDTPSGRNRVHLGVVIRL